MRKRILAAVVTVFGLLGLHEVGLASQPLSPLAKGAMGGYEQHADPFKGSMGGVIETASLSRRG